MTTALKLLYDLILYQLAGVVAVEATGGPTIDFVPGRKVCSVPSCEKYPIAGIFVSHVKLSKISVFMFILRPHVISIQAYFRIQRSAQRKDCSQILVKVDYSACNP